MIVTWDFFFFFFFCKRLVGFISSRTLKYELLNYHQSSRHIFSFLFFVEKYYKAKVSKAPIGLNKPMGGKRVEKKKSDFDPIKDFA